MATRPVTLGLLLFLLYLPFAAEARPALKELNRKDVVFKPSSRVSATGGVPTGVRVAGEAHVDGDAVAVEVRLENTSPHDLVVVNWPDPSWGFQVVVEDIEQPLPGPPPPVVPAGPSGPPPAPPPPVEWTLPKMTFVRYTTREPISKLNYHGRATADIFYRAFVNGEYLVSLLQVELPARPDETQLRPLPYEPSMSKPLRAGSVVHDPRDLKLAIRIKGCRSRSGASFLDAEIINREDRGQTFFVKPDTLAGLRSKIDSTANLKLKPGVEDPARSWSTSPWVPMEVTIPPRTRLQLSVPIEYVDRWQLGNARVIPAWWGYLPWTSDDVRDRRYPAGGFCALRMGL